MSDAKRPSKIQFPDECRFTIGQLRPIAELMTELGGSYLLLYDCPCCGAGARGAARSNELPTEGSICGECEEDLAEDRFGLNLSISASIGMVE